MTVIQLFFISSCGIKLIGVSGNNNLIFPIFPGSLSLFLPPIQSIVPQVLLKRFLKQIKNLEDRLRQPNLFSVPKGTGMPASPILNLSKCPICAITREISELITFPFSCLFLPLIVNFRLLIVLKLRGKG